MHSAIDYKKAWEELRVWAKEECKPLTIAKMDSLVPGEPMDELDQLRAIMKEKLFATEWVTQMLDTEIDRIKSARNP